MLPVPAEADGNTSAVAADERDLKERSVEQIGEKRCAMKRFLISMIALLILSGCTVKKEEKRDYEGEYAEVFRLLPDRPGEEDEIFIIANDGIHNEKVWDDFYTVAKEKEEADVIIALYTIEGDVIYEILRCDPDGFRLFTDNSRDAYASTAVPMQKRAHLYYYGFTSNEEVNGEMKPFDNRYCFISDILYKDQESFEKDLGRYFEGEEIDLYTVWAYSGSSK
jgi:hypothetical protein